MATAKFVKYPSFPLTNCSMTQGGMLWKMQVRQWAFAQVNAQQVGAGIEPESNNPNVVHGYYDKTEKGLKSAKVGTNGMTVTLYADAPGFTYLYLFNGNPAAPVSDRMQVEVVQRRAGSAGTVSLTKLSGKTYAIHSPDTNSYTMDKTDAVDGSMTDAANFFSNVPAHANHIVVSSHGGTPDGADKSRPDNLALFVTGANSKALHLDATNCEQAFKKLKGKVADNCVIWFGGCTIGNNNEFCKKAAIASGCPVVAPAMPLLAKKYPTGNIDILDQFAIPKVFSPATGQMITVSDFCAKQAKYNFAVPV